MNLTQKGKVHMKNQSIERINSNSQVSEQKKIIAEAVKGEDIELKDLFLQSSNEIKGFILAEIIDQGKYSLIDNLLRVTTSVIDQSVKDEALKLALLKGARAPIKMLIDKGADKSLVGEIKNPLMDALEKGDFDHAQNILNQRESIILEELEVAILHDRFEFLGVMLDKASSITYKIARNFAIQNGKTGAINIMLDRDPSQDIKNAALSYAITTYRNDTISIPNKLDAIEILILAGAIPNEKDFFGNP
jgi:hypothetical protein